MNAMKRARDGLDDRPWFFIFLLAPFLWILPAVPIDETRYLSVAWEMRQSADFITLHLNGFPYFDKPPLLFWLLNLVWSVFGTSLWVSRLLPLVFAAGCVALVRKLATSLDEDDGAHAAWLLLSVLYFELFAGVVMFDIMLCFFVLLAFHAVVAWVRHGARWAPWLLFAASALGMLAKGPVLLLHVLPPLLLSRWWAASGSAPPSWRRIGAASLACVAGGLPVLLWAWAAVRHRGLNDARELLVTQTAGRVVESFAHDRPAWWYLQWIVLFLLPWPLVLRWRRLRPAVAAARSSVAVRFGLCASLPALLAFSAVSGKQLHYLMPLLPGMAIGLAALLRVEMRLLDSRRMLLFCLLLLAVWVWALLRPGHISTPIAPAWLGLLYALSAVFLAAASVLAWKREGAELPRRTACVMLLLSVAMLPLIRLQALASMDLRGLAAAVTDLRQHGVPVVRTGHEPGLITYLARLPGPLPTVDDPARWAQEHPQGYVLIWSSHTMPEDVFSRVRAANGWAGLRPAAAWNRPVVAPPSGTSSP